MATVSSVCKDQRSIGGRLIAEGQIRFPDSLRDAMLATTVAVMALFSTIAVQRG